MEVLPLPADPASEPAVSTDTGEGLVSPSGAVLQPIVAMATSRDASVPIAAAWIRGRMSRSSKPTMQNMRRKTL